VASDRWACEPVNDVHGVALAAPGAAVAVAAHRITARRYGTGSVIVFITRPNQRRLAMVGDLVWQLEGITLREERPWLQRAIVDDDPAGVRVDLLRMAAVAHRYPQITIVPAHDARGFSGFPTL
jgi:hypothetical protein